MAAPSTTALPPAPLPNDSKSVFNAKAFPFVNALGQFQGEVNQLVSWLNSNINVRQPVIAAASNFDLPSTDSGAYVRAEYVGAKTITVQSEIDEPQQDGAMFLISNKASGNLTIIADTGVTISGNIQLENGAAAILQRVSADNWDFIVLGGDFTADLSDIESDISDLQSGKAPLASPAFTGNPTAPTPAANDNDTSIATTAFVQTALSDKIRVVATTSAASALTGLVTGQQISVLSDPDGGIFTVKTGTPTIDDVKIYSSATAGLYLERTGDINFENYYRKPKDLSGLIQTHGKNGVITGDSLSYNNYGFGFGYAATAQECYPGLRSWGFNLRDAIHMSDPCFVYGDNIPWHINNPSYAAVAINNTAPFVLPFNNRSLRIVVSGSDAEVTLTANSWSIADKRIVLHLAHSDGQPGKFDVYYNDNNGGADVFVQNVEVGSATAYQKFDPFTVIIPVNTVDSCARVILKNFTDENDDPISSPAVAFYVLAFGSKLTNVYTTGVGGSTSEFTDTNYASLIGAYDPDLLILCTGANDRFNYGIDRHLVALDSIFTKARATNPAVRIIHITTPPAQGGGNEGYYPDTEIRHGSSMRQWVSAVERLCALRDVEFFNQYRFFYDMGPSYLFVDGIHLSRNAGRDMLKALIASYFSSCGAPIEHLSGYSTYSASGADLMPKQIGRFEHTRATVILSGQFKMTYNHATTNWILSDNYEYGTNKPSAFKGFNIPGAAHTTNIEFFVPCVSTSYNECAFPLSATAEYVGGVSTLPLTGLTLKPSTNNTLQFIIRDIDGALIDPSTMDNAEFIIKYRM